MAAPGVAKHYAKLKQAKGLVNRSGEPMSHKPKKERVLL